MFVLVLVYLELEIHTYYRSRKTLRLFVQRFRLIAKIAVQSIPTKLRNSFKILKSTLLLRWRLASFW